MPLRLFGGQGSSRVCPACDSKISADATFCPSCFMVIRPEGAADLRAHLRGGRIPTDVYLLRKMQAEDPDTGPVVRVPSDASPLETGPEPVTAPPRGAGDVPSPSKTLAGARSPTLAARDPQPGLLPGAGAPRGRTDTPPRAHTWRGVHSLVRFDAPLPPPTHAVDAVPALFTWMLERDPVIPNNLDLLEGIHALAFPDGPAATLRYGQHILLLILDDLLLHPTQESLATHLGVLASAYRRAAGAYHAAAEKERVQAGVALWQMSNMASRLRVEAWVFHTRHGVPPDIIRPRRPRSSKPRAS